MIPYRIVAQRFPLLAFGFILWPACLAQSGSSYSITTVVGFGLSNVPNGAFGGDGGVATTAYLNSPTGIGLDGMGNLYVCDFNARIRKIDARTHIITTVAGTGTRGFSGDVGPAVDAELGGPGDIAVNAAGDIYFADGSNRRIRRISADAGVITTVAGSGANDQGSYRTVDGRTMVLSSGDGGIAVNAGIGHVSGIGLDAKGNFYFTNGSDRVRKVMGDTGILSTVAGAGGSYHSGDGGPAILAQLHQPSGLAIDATGNIYIAARGEHRIRKVDATTGVITTIAGDSPGSASGIMGIVTYRGRFAGDGGPATKALLNDPEKIALDKSGNLFISDTMNYRIRRIDAVTGIIDTIAGTGIKGFSGDTGSAVGAQITNPSGIQVDDQGRIYFGDESNHRVRILTPGFRPAPL